MSEPTWVRTNYYRQGVEARRMGGWWHDNPCKHDTPQWEAWYAGWCDEDRSLRTGDEYVMPDGRAVI